MYDLHDIVEMKKPHACQTNRWEVIRMGADIKIRCMNCGHIQKGKMAPPVCPSCHYERGYFIPVELAPYLMPELI